MARRVGVVIAGSLLLAACGDAEPPDAHAGAGDGDDAVVIDGRGSSERS